MTAVRSAIFSDDATELKSTFSHSQTQRAGVFSKPLPKAQRLMQDCHGRWVPIPDGPARF